MTKFINTISIGVAIIAFFLTACNYASPDGETSNFPADIPLAELQLISEFDQSGDRYFQSLHNETVPLPGGDVIIADQGDESIIQVDSNGNFIEQIARDGSGPGEVQHPNSLHGDGTDTILVYDRLRNVIIRKSLDSNSVEEFPPANINDMQVTGAYPTDDKRFIHLNLTDLSFIRNPDREPANAFAAYNTENEQIQNHFEYSGDTWAIMRDVGRVGGAVRVPFTPKFMYDYSTDGSEFYTYRSDESQINVLNPITLDTVRSIPIDIPGETLKQAEIDSLEEHFGEVRWPYVRDLLPEIKSPVDEMIVDHKNRFWLKLTLHSDAQQWVILNNEGEPVMRVQLPQEGDITHISEDHIGFRSDSHLFALYELQVPDL